MMKSRLLAIVLCLSFVVSLMSVDDAAARNPIRRTFFGLFPVAEGTQLDDLPSNAGHCGVCHFDFDGGGPRNPFGLGVEVGLGNGLSNEQAILAIENADSDGDGFINLTEITAIASWGNTPTFPGLTESNKGSVVNIPVAEVEPYLTPSGGTDSIPPTITVTSPDGGESIDANTYFSINYIADDDNGVSHLNIFLSDDAGATYKPVAINVTPGTGFSWFVPNRPGTASRIAVEAVDNSGNAATDLSDADFTIVAVGGGTAPTTFRDMDMTGTQPFEGAILDDPDASCADEIFRKLKKRALVRLARQHDGAGGTRSLLLRLHGHSRAGCAVGGGPLHQVPLSGRLAGRPFGGYERRSPECQGPARRAL